LAHIAQEGDDLKVGQPLVVVSENGGGGTAAEIDKSLDLILQVHCPLRNLRLGIELPLANFSARISDQPCPASDENDGTMTSTLEAAEHQEREQAANVETVGRRI